MSDNIRINTTPGGGDKIVNLQVNQKFDFIEILSLKISQDEAYNRFCSDYGAVVGRVIVNNGLGVPNAKVSVFIPVDEVDAEDSEVLGMYPYKEITTTDSDGIPYNLLPRNNRGKDNCFTPVGTFPSKREIQDNPLLSEVYCKYYKYTTTTNDSGDFMLFGLPVGTHFIHVNADVSDIGILSQRPYDLIKQGASEKSFKSSTKFKGREESSTPNQIKTASPISITVPPFWGDTEQCNIGIARSDVNLQLDIVPSAIFMGSIVSDNDKHALSRGCRPRKKLGRMDEIVTGEGRIEMIRKTLSGGIERFDVEGGEVIDGDGAWAYQIPMNRDYMVTSEDGTLVPSGDPSKGIPTTARVRFRIGMKIEGDEGRFRTRAKYLVPHNPSSWSKADFSFGTKTNDDNFTDLSWNNIYTVKNYVSRVQPNNNIENRNFIGVKNVDDPGSRNPFPYNKLDNDTNPLFIILCIIIRIIARLVGTINSVLIPLLNVVMYLLNGILLIICKALRGIGKLICGLPKWISGSSPGCDRKFCIGSNKDSINAIGDCDCREILNYIPYITLPCDGGDGKIYYVPGVKKESGGAAKQYTNGFEATKDSSKDLRYISLAGSKHKCTSDKKRTLEGCDAGWSECQSLRLADALDVFKFDFYNDWVNGTLYLFLLKYKKKRNGKEKFCEVDCDPINPDSDNNCKQSNYILDTCTGAAPQSSPSGSKKGVNSGKAIKVRSGYIKKDDGELYYSPITAQKDSKLFATGIVNLGSIFDCSWNGDQKLQQYLTDTTHQLPSLIDELDTDSSITPTPTISTGYSLFGEISCLGFATGSDNCNNLKRVCELGVGLDELRDLSKPDKKIGNEDVEEEFIRGIFAELNTPSITTGNSVFFDSTSSGFPDYQNLNYSHFRVTKTTGTFTGINQSNGNFWNKSIWVYDNSYYFYFGLNKGKTALSKMKRKYFTECVPEVDVDFYIVSDVITADDATATPTGAVSINVIGGVGPYTFTWSQVTVGTGTAAISYPTTTTTQNISDLVAGVYNVEVVDSIGTVTNGSFIVQGPTPVTCNVQSTNLTSNGANDGTISINVNGGSPVYTYELFNYNATSSAPILPAILDDKITITSKVFLNLRAGDYMVKVTDSTAPTPTTCENIVSISDSPALVVTLTPENITCNGDGDGNITATISGGIAPYDTEWTSTTNTSYGPFDSVFKISSLEAETYKLTVTDATGTNVVMTETITEPDLITFNSTPINGCNGSLGEIQISNIKGGTAPYDIELKNNEISYNVNRAVSNPTLELFTNLANGSTLYEEKPYELTITDDNGCVVSKIIELFVPKVQLTVDLIVNSTLPVDEASATRIFTVNINGGVYQDDTDKGPLYGYQVEIQRKTPGGSFVTLKTLTDVTNTTYMFTENYSSLGLTPNPNPPVSSPSGTAAFPSNTIQYEYKAIVYDKNGDADACKETSTNVTVNIKIT
jgi:hypothetical protein